MMGSRGFHIVHEKALDLSVAERAKLAHDLLASLDGSADANATEDWDREVLRRLDEIDSGAATLIDRKEFSRRLFESLRRDP